MNNISKYCSYLSIFLLVLVVRCATAISPIEEEIRPGAYQLDILLPEIQGKKVGVVANHASLVNNTHLLDTLIKLNGSKQLGTDINAIFSPEHGFSGLFDAGKVIEAEELIFDSIQVISLYGKDKKPKQEDLSDIDVMLFDLQDVGVRFYTYISTLHYVMQACAENDVQLIVLDRPNPHVNYIDGPILKKEFQSFVGMHPVPIVYGMTIGEYGLMINGEGWLGEGLFCDLKVVEIENFTRISTYDIPTKPSPNLPNMQSILLYPSICLFEGTVMSVGRGTDWPFQVVGHPNYPIDSFSFKPTSTPGASLYPKLEDEKCYGINYSNLELDSLRYTSEINIGLLLSIYQTMDVGEGFFTDYFKLLAGTDSLRNQILQNKSEKEIRDSWKPGLKSFNVIREKYLIYN